MSVDLITYLIMYLIFKKVRVWVSNVLSSTYSLQLTVSNVLKALFIDPDLWKHGHVMQWLRAVNVLEYCNNCLEITKGHVV